ncbi:DUF1127 domain-containing protein [Stutzerimonas stutzeri]|uniref:DUF1127 domain-containing protein n=1 Tax=Stutzerimonas stutzeri TaxID=316 RepID=UPI00210DE60C|nr:DUF1127 domain-containing protein [Stutzerimonas stutzeri]MCQ4319038.1 DUF1127 domain-containing protein [Stutzerimonas stutzeri]
MDRALSRPVPLRQPGDALAKLLRLLHLWRQRSDTRRQLATLDDRLLADIGISNSERIAELDKPFWR